MPALPAVFILMYPYMRGREYRVRWYAGNIRIIQLVHVFIYQLFTYFSHLLPADANWIHKIQSTFKK